MTISELKRWDVLWASGFGLGFLPKAPGTWGSLGALLVWWVGLSHLETTIQAAVAIVYFFSGWWVSSRICRRSGVDDAPEIVADEIAGLWIALCLVPEGWIAYLAAFVMFRFFDITKPGPIGVLDRDVKGGLGVMLDDVLAGLFAGGLIYVGTVLLLTYRG